MKHMAVSRWQEVTRDGKNLPESKNGHSIELIFIASKPTGKGIVTNWKFVTVVNNHVPYRLKLIVGTLMHSGMCMPRNEGELTSILRKRNVLVKSIHCIASFSFTIHTLWDITFRCNGTPFTRTILFGLHFANGFLHHATNPHHLQFAICNLQFKIFQ